MSAPDDDGASATAAADAAQAPPPLVDPKVRVCAYCKKPGATKKCNGCRQRTYCDKKCQRKDWEKQHDKQCKKLRQVFVPPPLGWRGEGADVVGPVVAARSSESGSGGAACAAGGAGADNNDDGSSDDEPKDPCPICLVNEDDAEFDGKYPGMCSACGQMYCGACCAGGLAQRSPNCPTCRAPLAVSDEEDFKRAWKLVHDRSPGRHTPVAQCSLGVRYAEGRGVRQSYANAAKYYKLAADQGDATAQFNVGAMYENGKGVRQDYAKAMKYYKLAAEQGVADAQYNLGSMNYNGTGVQQDDAKACKWIQLAAIQGHANAMKALDIMQKANGIPAPPSGTAVTTILLTSPASSKYNSRSGIVVTPSSTIKPGKVCVLLDGETNALAFKLKNVQVTN